MFSPRKWKHCEVLGLVTLPWILVVWASLIIPKWSPGFSDNTRDTTYPTAYIFFTAQSKYRIDFDTIRTITPDECRDHSSQRFLELWAIPPVEEEFYPYLNLTGIPTLFLSCVYASPAPMGSLIFEPIFISKFSSYTSLMFPCGPSYADCRISFTSRLYIFCCQLHLTVKQPTTIPVPPACCTYRCTMNKELNQSKSS